MTNSEKLINSKKVKMDSIFLIDLNTLQFGNRVPVYTSGRLVGYLHCLSALAECGTVKNSEPLHVHSTLALASKSE